MKGLSEQVEPLRGSEPALLTALVPAPPQHLPVGDLLDHLVGQTVHYSVTDSPGEVVTPRTPADWLC